MWGGRRRNGGGGNGRNVALLLMLLRQVNDLDRKPPLTLGLVATMYGLHFQKNRLPAAFRAFSLCPDKVIANREFSRLVGSAFLHVDDWHLYHNMASLLWKGYHLEGRMGSLRLGLLIGYLLVLSHALVVIVAYLMDTLLQIHGPLHQCSIGFSGVLFALKVVLNYNSPAFSSVYGFRVPTKYAAWLELALIHVLVPHSSFMGHMCGILAGYLYVLAPGANSVLQSCARWVERTFRRMQTTHARQSPPPSPRAGRNTAGAGNTGTGFSSDEELARRLQEEEFRRAEEPQQPPPILGADELRRRRVARFQQ